MSTSAGPNCLLSVTLLNKLYNTFQNCGILFHSISYVYSGFRRMNCFLSQTHTHDSAYNNGCKSVSDVNVTVNEFAIKSQDVVEKE